VYRIKKLKKAANVQRAAEPQREKKITTVENKQIKYKEEYNLLGCDVV
jgi:hypothetical protein